MNEDPMYDYVVEIGMSFDDDDVIAELESMDSKQIAKAKDQFPELLAVAEMFVSKLKEADEAEVEL